MQNDLLIKNGIVIDPSQGINGKMDVAFSGGKVSALKPNIPARSASKVIDASGKYVTPGFIDVHAHVYRGSLPVVQGEDCEKVHVPNGLTTVVDGGSVGAPGFSDFRNVAKKTKCRVLAWVNLSKIAIRRPGIPQETRDLKANVDLNDIAKALRENKDFAVGIKVRMCWRGSCGNDVAALELAVKAGELCHVPIMVHVGNSIITMPEILARLRPGDIVTHAFTLEGNGIVDSRLRILEACWEARKRGIFFDSNHGIREIGFKVGRSAVAQGFPPDFISDDMVEEIVPKIDLLQNMSEYLVMGMTLEDVIARVTCNPAAYVQKYVGIEGLGTLKVGLGRDAAVLELVDGKFTYVDPTGDEIVGNQNITNTLTVKDGEIIWARK